MDKEKVISNKKRNSLTIQNKLLINLLIAFIIFGFGWLVGSDRISFGQSNLNSNQANKSLPAKLDYSSIDDIYASLKSKYDGELKEEDLINGLKSGLVKAAGDPYTEYLNPKDAEEFNGTLEGTFEGIGAELGKDKDNNIIIISPISGYPAEKAGLLSKDMIAEINGEPAYDLTISEAVKKIRGEKGTEVNLKIVRKGEIKEFNITREEINIPSVKTEIKDGIGIITISQFGDDTTALTREAADKMIAANVKGIILDLRGNTGGYLNSAVDVSSLWLENDSVILTERRGDVVVKTYNAKGVSKLGKIKTVVLINQGSASASEIVAGALKDNNKAVLIGETSYGKGSVQEPMQLDDGGILKITIARWYTPGGKNIDKEGIEPDTKVELTSNDITSDKDPQLDAAIKQLRN